MDADEDGLGFLSVAELRGEVKRLADILARNDDCEIKVYDRIISAVLKLRRLRLQSINAVDAAKKDNDNGSRCNPRDAMPAPAKNNKLDALESLAVPECFLCPISSELMADPVMVATGQTYDRPYIQTWFDADHRTCPKTQQQLPHLNLTPNYLVRSMIEQWCEVNGIEQQWRTPALGGADEAVGVMPHEVKYLNMIVDKLSSRFLSQQREAAQELRALTRKKHSHRVFLSREPRCVQLLIGLLRTSDAETQEHTVTTLFNLSIYKANKCLIADEHGIAPVVEVLRQGLTPAARENAAATLFNLSTLDQNKERIGESEGAIEALVALLAGARSKDAASALFNLCLRPENRDAAVRAGVVAAVKGLLQAGNLRDESVAVLALVASARDAVAELASGAAEWLDALAGDVLRDPAASAHTKENALVVLLGMCSHEAGVARDIRADAAHLQTVVALSVAGPSSRSRRKATSLVERINRQCRNLTI